MKIKSIKKMSNHQEYNLLFKIRKEIDNQFNKWNIQEHSFEKWYMILMEEILEITQEYLSKSDKNIEKLFNIQKEIIQSITLLIQMYYGIDIKITDKCNKIFINNEKKKKIS